MHRSRRMIGLAALGVVVVAVGARGPIGRPHHPSHHVHGRRPGPIARATHRVAFAIKDRMIGEPARFVAPPAGSYVSAAMSRQAANANQHQFTLYRSDFLAGTDRLTMLGSRRLSRMVGAWHHWPGPLLIEADPWRPGLAEQRRASVADLLARGAAPIAPERMLVGASPYLGQRGTLAEGYNGILIQRSFGAPAEFELPPTPNASLENSGGGGSN